MTTASSVARSAAVVSAVADGATPSSLTARAAASRNAVGILIDGSGRAGAQRARLDRVLDRGAVQEAPSGHDLLGHPVGSGRKHIGVTAEPGNQHGQRLFNLKRKWQVSLGALLMRASALDRMSESQYRSASQSSQHGCRETSSMHCKGTLTTATIDT